MLRHKTHPDQRDSTSSCLDTRNMVMIPLELVRGDTATMKQRERDLINRHQTIRFGINEYKCHDLGYQFFLDLFLN